VAAGGGMHHASSSSLVIVIGIGGIVCPLARYGTTFDGQTDKSKSTEFVCSSSTVVDMVRRLTARRISQKVHRLSVVNTMFDGQTDK
jgi:hypothetical protein